jgi:hypothetical protein
MCLHHLIFKTLKELMKITMKFSRFRLVVAACLLVISTVIIVVDFNQHSAPRLDPDKWQDPIFKIKTSSMPTHGSGTWSDPYFVQEEDYMVDSSEEEREAARKTAVKYNNGGKRWIVKTDGGDVYVRYDIKIVDKWPPRDTTGDSHDMSSYDSY